MKIVIAAGIYPPEVGGPALYAEGVKKSLEKSGHQAPVILFSTFRKFPSGIRHFLYTAKLISAARGADAIFAFDTYSVGVPAVFVGLVMRVPVVIRIGGDFLWESYVQRTQHLVPLPHFYERSYDLAFKERVARSLVGWMLRHAILAFNTRWLLDIWARVYGFSVARAHVVENVIGEKLAGHGSDRTILLYGRLLVLKNAEAFRRAVASVQVRGANIKLEEGTLPHEAFLRRVRQAHAIAVPSISDVAPNAVIDAIRCGKPFLLTKYSGYAERFGKYGVVVDPLDEKDMERGVAELADPATYEALRSKIVGFNEVHTYDDIAREFLALVPR